MMSNCSQFNFQTGTCTQVDKDFDYSVVLQFDDAAGNIDLTGFVLVGTIKDGLGGSTLLSLAIVGDDQTTGFYIPVLTDGAIQFIIKKETAAGISAGVYPYEFILTNPSGDDSIFMQGTIQFANRGF